MGFLVKMDIFHIFFSIPRTCGLISYPPGQMPRKWSRWQPKQRFSEYWKRIENGNYVILHSHVAVTCYGIFSSTLLKHNLPKIKCFHCKCTVGWILKKYVQSCNSDPNQDTEQCYHSKKLPGILCDNPLTPSAGHQWYDL